MATSTKRKRCSEDTVMTVREAIKAGMKQTEVRRLYGVPKTTFYEIKNEMPLYGNAGHKKVSTKHTKIPTIRRHRTMWPKDTIVAVCKAIKGGMSIREGCRLYGIPRSTFYDKMTNKTPIGCTSGQKPFFTEAEETRFLKYVEEMAIQGTPVRMEALCDLIQKMVSDDGRVTPFRKGRPGRKWVESFLRRYPKVKEMLATIPKGPARLSKGDILLWFSALNDRLDKIEALDLLNHPERIFTTDEMGLIFYSGVGTFITPRKIPLKQLNQEYEQIVLLYSFSATGELAPSMVVYKGQHSNSVVHHSMPEGFVARTSEGTASLNSNIFLEYCKLFHSWLVNKGIQSHVLLFDRHNFDVNIAVHEYCAEHKIVLVKYPNNSASILQPAHVGIFKQFKSSFEKEVHGCKLTKVSLWPYLCKSLRHSLNLKFVQDVFSKCGLFPFDPNAPNYTLVADDSNGKSDGIVTSVPSNASVFHQSLQANEVVDTEHEDVDSEDEDVDSEDEDVDSEDEDVDSEDEYVDSEDEDVNSEGVEADTEDEDADTGNEKVNMRDGEVVPTTSGRHDLEKCDVFVVKQYIEKTMSPELVEEFRATKESGQKWSGDVAATLLYSTWLSLDCDKRS